MNEEILIKCVHDKMVAIAELAGKRNKKNRNTHPPEQIAELVEQFRFQGIRHPIIISNRTGLIVAGDGRFQAAQKMGMIAFPVDFQDFANEAEEFSFGIADNSIASWAQLDLKAIHLDLPDMEPFPLERLAIQGFELEPTPGETDPDAVPEPPKVAKTKRGELWILGEHRLLIDDCTVKENIERLMAGERADMVFTDPPYGINLDTDYSFATNTYDNVKSKGGNKYTAVAGDAEDYDPTPILSAFPYCTEIFLWGADYFAERIPQKNSGSWVVWDKRQNDETDDAKAESADKAFGSSFELCWSKTKHKRVFARIRSGIFGVNNEQGNSKRVHPTEKPVQLAEWFFDRWGKGAKNIWDGYLGSGSTLIACEKTNRRCFGMEIEPLYGDVILDRWEKFSGKKAVREDGTTWAEVKGA